MIKIFYFAVYLVIWIYVLPELSEEYQFILKVLLISLPFLLGIQHIQEKEEKFLDKSKIVAQLVDIPNKSSIALVYSNGTIDFLDQEIKKKKKKKPQQKKKSPQSNKSKNWYNSLTQSK